jgi:hypothetical protein
MDINTNVPLGLAGQRNRRLVRITREAALYISASPKVSRHPVRDMYVCEVPDSPTSDTSQLA